MIREGMIVLFPFPQTDLSSTGLHPAVVLRRLPGPHDDWLVCMVSSQLRHEIAGMDEVVRNTDADFAATGLKMTSLIRATRLAVVSGSIFSGAIGRLGAQRLDRIRIRISRWIQPS